LSVYPQSLHLQII